MGALEYVERKPVCEPSGTASRVPVRKLALATALGCLAAQLLSLADQGGGPHGGPLGVVIGQVLWNAAEVGLLILLLCLWRVHRRWWVMTLGVASLACLPFATYVISPGGRALAVLVLLACGLAWTRKVPDLDVDLVDAPARGTPLLTKFEFLAFVCNLLCSMYNFKASRGVWPYWERIYEKVGNVIGFTPDPAAVAQGMFSLGLPDVSLPSYIAVGAPANNLGAVVFALVWSLLPVLYVLYFAALAKMAKNSPGAWAQQALCLFCIFHFLFLTDFVDYKYGRGIENPAATAFHWAEVFAWRIAVLLPIYQKVTTGQWLRGNGRIGIVVHYGFAAWAFGFLVYEVMLYNVPWFTTWALGLEYRPVTLFGRGYSGTVGYNGALVLLTFLYGFAALALRAKRVVSGPSAPDRAAGSEPQSAHLAADLRA